jgi:gliding motility-associated-like protein
VNPSYSSTITASICANDSIQIAGVYRKLEGLYADTLSAVTGCDSIIVTNLTVHPIYTSNTSATICDNDSLLIGGVYRKVAGIYAQGYTSINGCDSSVLTNLIILPLPTADAGSDQSIPKGASIIIGTAAIGGNQYLWTPSTALNNDSIAQPNANPTVTITYQLLVTDLFTGCQNTDNVTVNVLPGDLEFFNGFSPNGDGFNDYWRIPVLSYNPTNSVTIISRWGNEVWRADNYNNADVVWTGKNMNGDLLPDGTYYYIIVYGDIDKRGWVFIKR